MSRVIIPVLGCSFALLAVSACRHDGRTLRPALPSQSGSVFTPTTTTTIVDDAAQPFPSAELPGATSEGTDVAFTLTMPWADGGIIDNRYTCNGEDVSPAVSWLGAPVNAVELALVVTDSDANDFVHWVIAGLDPKNPTIPEGRVPVGAIEGTNGFSTGTAPVIGWRGPCPPKGVTHHYRFALYALDQQIELPTGSSAADLMSAIDASSLQAAQISGIYASP